jgi:prepilin-type N-terminal cleavage/methylation domain-containing protein
MSLRRLPRRGCHAARGFSLVELMLTLFVFTVGALGLCRLMYSSAAGVTVGGKITTAATLTRTKLDELVTLPYTDTNLTTGTHVDGTNNLGPAGTPYTPNGGSTGPWGCLSPPPPAQPFDGWFARSWLVSEDAGAAFKTIIVTACWWDPMARTARQVSTVGGRSNQ